MKNASTPPGGNGATMPVWHPYDEPFDPAAFVMASATNFWLWYTIYRWIF